MATVTTLVDDLDGTPATQTLTFAVQSEETGKLIEIEIDLNDKNYDKYNEILLQLASVGREVKRDVPVPVKRSAKPVTKSGGTAHIREALRAAGHEVSDRGRISAPLMEIYAKLDKSVSTTSNGEKTEGGETGTAGDPEGVDEDKKAEKAVIARVKATPKAAPTTRRAKNATTKPKNVEIPAIREVLTLVGEK